MFTFTPVGSILGEEGIGLEYVRDLHSDLTPNLCYSTRLNLELELGYI